MKNRSLGKLISAISRNGIKYIDSQLKPFNLGFGQFQILLEMEDGKKLTQMEIAQQVGLDKTTIARTIKKLESLDYIKRDQNKADSRAYEITLTNKGLIISKKIRKILKNYTEQLSHGITGNDKEKLLSSLETVLKNSINLQ